MLRSRAHLTFTHSTANSVQVNGNSRIGTVNPRRSLSCSHTRGQESTMCCSLMGESFKRVAAPHSHAALCIVVFSLIALLVYKLSYHLATNLSLRAFHQYRLNTTFESWLLITAHCRHAPVSFFSGSTRRSQMRSRCTLEPKHGENKSLNIN